MIPIHSICEYVRNPDGSPKACVVATKRADGTIGIGHAIHNPKDQFDRKLMHQIALGRAQQKETAVIAAPRYLQKDIKEKLKLFKIRCTKYYKVDIDDIPSVTVSSGPSHAEII